MFKLYNPDRKNRFLDENYQNEDTKSTYASILMVASIYEDEKGKDLCDFSYSEIIDLMIGLQKKTQGSSSVARTIISKYIDWCITEEYSKTGINATKLLTKDDLQKYTNQVAQKKSYITRNRLYEITGELYNYIDKALVALLFE